MILIIEIFPRGEFASQTHFRRKGEELRHSPEDSRLDFLRRAFENAIRVFRYFSSFGEHLASQEVYNKKTHGFLEKNSQKRVVKISLLDILSKSTNRDLPL